MAGPLYPVSAVPFEGPAGYSGGAFDVDFALGAGGNNANGAMVGPWPMVNPQQLASALGGAGLLAAGGPGVVAGLAPMGAYLWYSGMAGSGFHPTNPPPPNCMTCPQLNNPILYIDCVTLVFFSQFYCVDCNSGQVTSVTSSSTTTAMIATSMVS